MRPVRALCLGAGVLVLAACSTTAASTTPGVADLDAEPTTLPLDPLDETTTTTIEPTSTTEAPTTTVEPTTTTEATTTTVEATTTTMAPPTIPLAALDEPIAAVGTADGAETARLQQRLLDLGFWVQATDGDYGLTTRQAVMAFQKFYGLETDGVFGEETAATMASLTERPRARADAGTLVEVDKSLQLLFFVIDGRTEWILNTSTGTEIPYEEANKNDPDKIERGDSITPVGLHAVNRQREDGWWEGDLGEIYRPKYFVGGVAVHGSNSIPDYPASHGCVRVSVPAMDWIWETGIMPMDTPVWVHGEIPA